MANRSIWKGFFIENSILKLKHKKESEILKVYSRASIIPIFLSKKIFVYNGKSFIELDFTFDYIGYKFGEFAETRTLGIPKAIREAKKAKEKAETKSKIKLKK